MSLLSSLANMAPSDASILHSTLLAVALLIAVAAAYNRYSRPAPTKVSAEKDPNYLPDPSPYVGFDLKTARTRDFIYANKVSQCLSASSGEGCQGLMFSKYRLFVILTSRRWPTSRCILTVRSQVFQAPAPTSFLNAAFADWIEIDKDYLRDINMKRAVIDEHTERALNSLPENDAAAGELLEILVDYLPKVRRNAVSQLCDSNPRPLVFTAVPDVV